jgi:hypothetical protein
MGHYSSFGRHDYELDVEALSTTLADSTAARWTAVMLPFVLPANLA